MLVDTQLKPKIFPVFVLVLVVMIGVLMYREAFLDLVERWETQEEYSHGFLIPFVSFYFIWQKKQLLQRIPLQPTWLGFSLVFVGLILYFIGKTSILFILLDYSFILVLIGFIWSVIGTQAIKVIIVPLLMLIFAIPLPYYIDALLSSKLQLLSSRLGVEFIIWCKIPVFLEGNVIDLGNYKLQVVEACSGLRYLFPLMSIGFICAYMLNTVFWKRALVFLSSIPITILMNSFRIGVVGFLVDNWGIETAEGFLHDFEGWVVFMSSIGLLMIEMLLIIKLGKDSRSFTEVFGVIDELPATDIKHQYKQQQSQSLPLLFKCKLKAPFFVSFSALIMVGGVFFINGNRNEIIPERQSFIDFPNQIKSWQGRRLSIDNPTLKNLELTDYILADYKGNYGKTVNFYVAYYESQRRSVVPHSPRVCIPGGGWEIAGISRITVDGFPVNRLLIKKGLAKKLVYYWYQQRGQVIANEFKMKWSLFKDALILNRTDGALVRLTTDFYRGENSGDAETRLNDLLAALMPLLGDYIPS
jgi:exosortase D (VPLPA-CTERM-specific)